MNTQLKALPVSVNSVAEDLGKQYPKLEDRIVKAVALIQAQDIWFYEHDSKGEPVYYCKSSDGKAVYKVRSGSCSCVATKLCYHRIARGILVILSANKTAVAFGEAIALENQEPPTPQATIVDTQDPSVCATHPAYVPTSKRVQNVGKMSPHLTIRNSMDRLGRRIVEVFTARPVSAKLH